MGFGPWQAAVSSRPAGQQANRPAGQKAWFLLGNCQRCLEISKKSKVSMGQQPTPRGVAGGAKAPNICQCWWLFGPWQAAVSSRPAGQQANRPAGQQAKRPNFLLGNCQRCLEISKNRRFLWGSNHQ